MKIKNTYNISPSTNIIAVLENSGYTLSTAIADIVDNCIDAKAKNIWIYFLYDGKKSKIIIIDDGIGMTHEEIISAATYADKSITDMRENKSLGKYSLGLKSASSSFAKKLYIQSYKKELNTILLDFENMKDTKKWEVCDVINYDTHLKTKVGTAIIWEDIKFMQDGLSRLGMYEKSGIVADHLSHVFSSFLIEDEIKIYVNDNAIKGWDPFFKQHTKTIRNKIKPILFENENIEIEVYIIPGYSTLKESEKRYVSGKGFNAQQGFYIYRNNRLIVEGGWLDLKDINFGDKFASARIKVNINEKLDEYFCPDFKKSSISIPDKLQISFTNIAKEARKKARENFEYIRNPSIKSYIKINDNIPVWNVKNTNNGVIMEINSENTLIKDLTKNLTEREYKKLLRVIEKGIPFSVIHKVDNTDNITQDEYSELIKDYYNNLMINNKLSKDDIFKEISKTEPFNLYKEWLVDFITEMGDL